MLLQIRLVLFVCLLIGAPAESLYIDISRELKRGPVRNIASQYLYIYTPIYIYIYIYICIDKQILLQTHFTKQNASKSKSREILEIENSLTLLQPLKGQ